MNFMITFFHKFCSFWSCGLRESSRVDYTADFEEEERLREKSFCMFQINITSPQREEIFFREIKN